MDKLKEFDNLFMHHEIYLRDFLKKQSKDQRFAANQSSTHAARRKLQSSEKTIREFVKEISQEQVQPRIPVWRYSLGSIKECDWAIFIIDAVGCFTVLSDFGNYSYRWHPSGMHNKDNFRLDIINKHPEYVIRKLGGEQAKDYDAEATLKSVKQFILSSRRCGENKELCRQAWNNIEIYDNLDDEINWVSWGNASGLEEWYETCVKRYPRHLVKLVEWYLPKLKEAICLELNKETEQIAKREKA